MCWHKWGKWSEPYEVTYTSFYQGVYKVGTFATLKQKRFCLKCDKMKEREVRR